MDSSVRYPRGSEIVTKLIFAGYDPQCWNDKVVCKPVNIQNENFVFELDSDEQVMDEVRLYLDSIGRRHRLKKTRNSKFRTAEGLCGGRYRSYVLTLCLHVHWDHAYCLVLREDTKEKKMFF